MFPRRSTVAIAQARRRHRAREFGDLCELTDGDAARWKQYGIFAVEELLLDAFRDRGYLAFLDIVRRESGERVSRLKAKVRRPSYYEAENARRRALAAERRKIRVRRTDNACPTKEQILDAWIAKKPLRSYRRYRRKVPLTNLALE